MRMRVMSSPGIAGPSGVERELDPEGGAASFAGPVPDHRDRARVLADDAVSDGETESGTGAHVLGGEEGVEDALLRSLRYAGPGVAEPEPHHALPDDGVDVDELGGGIRQRVTGVGQEVDEDLLQLDGVAEDEGIFGAEVQPHVDLAEVELLFQEREGTSDDVVDPKRLPADGGRPAERANVRDD